MAIRWKVRDIAERQGIKNPVELQERLGVVYNTARGLWFGFPSRIDLPTLNRVCVRLNCTPGDLLEFDGAEYSEENHNAEIEIPEAA